MGTLGEIMTGNYDRTVTAPSSGSSKVNVGDSERMISVASGALLSVLAVKAISRSGWGLALLGGALLFRGTTGYCPVNALLNRNTTEETSSAIDISENIIVNKPISEVYSFWRQLENLPKFMSHLNEVVQLDRIRSRWEARIPGGLGVFSWDAEIVEESENNNIKWQSLHGSSIDNAGEVKFTSSGSGTEVQIFISYRPPVADLGKAVAKLLNPVFAQLIKKDIQEFKRVIESRVREPQIVTSRLEDTALHTERI